MTGTLIEKILSEHLVAGQLTPGQEIAIRIDQTLTQDITGTMAYLELEAMGVTRASVPLALSYVDHNTAQFGPNNQNDHRYLQSMAASLGVKFSRPGNGICHQVHLERFAAPAKTLLGSDSHTPTAGGMGSIAIGAGGLDVALAMAGEPFRLICPRVVGVKLTGQFPPWVAPKDVILKLLSILTTVGNAGSAVEYFGPALASLSVPDRATITNMGAELGVTTSIFPSDANTLAFLTAQQRADDYRELTADAGAQYDRLIEIDLSTLEPLLACPSSPDNIKTVAELAGTKIYQVCLGSCTNSSFRDLTLVGLVLRGKTIHSDVSMSVSPGSRQVYQMIAASGTLSDLLAAGCRVLESACGPCIGVGFSPGTGLASLRSFNRNFSGRSGTPADQVYLASPEVLAVSALTGQITDPRTLDIKYPKIARPTEFLIDDRMIIEPPPTGTKVHIARASTIGQPPQLDPLPDKIDGTVLLALGDKVTTDHISPAGQHLKWRSNIAEYAKVAFDPFNSPDKPTFADRALALKAAGTSTVIVAGKSYGQGSSREHAAICPRFLGVRLVLAEGFERIHSANLVNWGIIPASLKSPADRAKLELNDELQIEKLHSVIADQNEITIRNLTKGTTVTASLDLTDRQRKILLAGGRLNYKEST